MSECISNDAKGNIAITGKKIKTVTLNGKLIYDQEKIYACNCKTPLYKTAPEMYESNALCLDETCVMQIAFTFACAKCDISKDTKCKDCPIAAGMRAMFGQRDRIAKLQKEARGER